MDELSWQKLSKAEVDDLQKNSLHVRHPTTALQSHCNAFNTRCHDFTFHKKYRYFLFIFVHHELIVLSPSVADEKHFISIITRLNCFDKLVFLIPMQSSPSKENIITIVYYTKGKYIDS